MSYAELACVTNFTFGHGASHPFELVRTAGLLGYTALAVCDECSVAGVVRAHEVASEIDLPLIIGSQFRLPDGDRVILLAPDHTAYTRICRLITLPRGRAEKGTYLIERADFTDLRERKPRIQIRKMMDLQSLSILVLKGTMVRCGAVASRAVSVTEVSFRYFRDRLPLVNVMLKVSTPLADNLFSMKRWCDENVQNKHRNYLNRDFIRHFCS